MKLIDIHIHGGFGVNFNTASAIEINDFARKVKKRNIVAFCPTLATDNIENINKQLREIKLAMSKQEENEAKILGVHLEALFLNPQKAGIHNADYFLKPSIENFKKLENREIIKIVTAAFELDEESNFLKYLKLKNIKAQIGHSVAQSLMGADCVTHLFNATPPIHHREPSLTLDALNNDGVYCEVIADLEHTSENMLKLLFKAKNHNKIILISDALPITSSNLESIEFCGQKIYSDGKNDERTIGGSVMFLDDIVKQLDAKGLLPRREGMKMAYENVINYLGLDHTGTV